MTTLNESARSVLLSKYEQLDEKSPPKPLSYEEMFPGIIGSLESGDWQGIIREIKSNTRLKTKSGKELKDLIKAILAVESNLRVKIDGIEIN